MTAGNITPTSAAPFIPEVWAGRALGAVAGNLVLGQLAARDWANFPQGYGDTINIPKRGAVTVAAKTPGSDVTPQQPADAPVQVILDSHYVGAVLVEDIVRAEANQDVGAGYVQDIAVALAEKIEVTGLTAAYTGFTTNSAVGTAATDAGEALVRSVGKALADAKVPQTMPKYVVWSTKDIFALLGLARFTEAQILGDGGTALRSADMGKMFGMTHIMSQYVPTTGSPLQTHNVAFAPDALTLAMRPLRQPQAPGASSSTIAGPAGTAGAGMGLRVTVSYEGKSMGDLLTVDALWGWAVVRADFGVQVLT